MARSLRRPAAELEPPVIEAAGRAVQARQGLFPTRDEMVSYLEDYAVRHRLKVLPATRLQRLDPQLGGWLLQTSSGDISAHQVVVASGYAHTPFMLD